MELVAVTMMGALSDDVRGGCVTVVPSSWSGSLKIYRERRNRRAGAAMSRSMERRNAQVFEVEEVTELSADEPIEVSAPTVVTSAAPLPACATSSAPTRREIPVARPPGTPLGATRAPRRARLWASVALPVETAPVARIPMPGERPSADAVTLVQAPRRDEPSRAAERRAEYAVERELPPLARPRRVLPGPAHADARQVYVLVAIIAVFAAFVMLLSAVVVRQQAELRQVREPARRAAEACAAYADEVHAIARELTQAAGDLTVVEGRIGARARHAVDDRGLQRLCAIDADARRWACPGGDPACLASAVMQLRQVLGRGGR